MRLFMAIIIFYGGYWIGYGENQMSYGKYCRYYGANAASNLKGRAYVSANNGDNHGTRRMELGGQILENRQGHEELSAQMRHVEAVIKMRLQPGPDRGEAPQAEQMV
jgi:hypothetical protein